MKLMTDFTQSNKWRGLRKKATSTVEASLFDYMELLERQIQTLYLLVNRLENSTTKKEDDGK